MVEMKQRHASRTECGPLLNLDASCPILIREVDA